MARVIRRAATALSDTLGPGLLDEGFFNNGVQHRGDFGPGRRAEPGVHPDGPPLSFSAQYAEGIADRDFAREGVEKVGGGNSLPDPCRFEAPMTASDLPGTDIARCPDGATALIPEFGADDLSGLRIAVDGAFKTPTLRNVEFTGPYMHDGGMSTPEQVTEFYNRGGDFVSHDLADNIEPLDLTEEQQADLGAFLRTLTDSARRCCGPRATCATWTTSLYFTMTPGNSRRGGTASPRFWKGGGCAFTRARRALPKLESRWFFSASSSTRWIPPPAKR